MTKRNFIFRVCGVMASPLGWYGGKARAQETTGVGIPTNVAWSLGETGETCGDPTEERTPLRNIGDDMWMAYLAAVVGRKS